MKIQHVFGLVFFLFILNMGFAQQIHILSDFDRGSMGSLKQVSENKFSGQPMHWIKKDKIGNQYYWFYFQITNVKNRKLTFEFNNLIGVYRNTPHEVYTDSTQPVISYDNHNWSRIQDVGYSSEKKDFTFSVDFKQDTAWIAYAHPYSYTNSKSYIDLIEKSKYAQVIKKGLSPEGRAINLLEITNPNSGLKNRKCVFIQAVQHAGEDCGGYFSEGLINFLISDDPKASKIRDKFVFYVVPVMNPDGLFNGCSRYNMNMEDLNSEWDDDISDTLNLPVEPEVLFIKNWLSDFNHLGSKLDLFIDVHSHSQFNTQNSFFIQDDELSRLNKIVNDFWSLNTYNQNEFSGSASWFVSTQYKVPSATLELTQSHIGDHKYINTDDYRYYGKTFAIAVANYLSK